MLRPVTAHGLLRSSGPRTEALIAQISTSAEFRPLTRVLVLESPTSAEFLSAWRTRASGPPSRQNDRVTAARILVVEDSKAIRLPVVTALSAQGFELASAANGGDLEKLLPSFAPDLVILDVMLPGRDGFELLRVVRRTSTAAVLMLTARDSLGDRLQGLTGGADDYLIKPFAMAELVARIHAVLRRSRPGGSSISIDDLVINDDATLVQRGGDPLEVDRDRAAVAWLPRRASGQGRQQDPNPYRGLGV